MMKTFSFSSVSLFCLLSLGLGCVSTPSQAGWFSSNQEEACHCSLPNFTALVEANGKAVVNIQAIRTSDSGWFSTKGLLKPFGADSDEPTKENPELSGGSGFILSPDGLILTNAHLIDGAKEITVNLVDKRSFKAKLIGSDAKTDIALLKIEAKDLPTLRIGDSNHVKVGEWVAAIGSPFGLDNTMTAGIVSALSRNLPSEQYTPFIQTDVPVNPGNSGGPLFNMKGEVVGINSQIVTTSNGFQGLSFAIPINLAMQIKDQLLAQGRVNRGFIGVHIQEMDAKLQEALGLPSLEGALITEIDPHTPGETAGLKVGDVILSVNGQPIKDSFTLPRIISEAKPSEHLKLGINREGKAIHIEVVVAPAPQSNEELPSKNLEKIGIKLRELNHEEKARYPQGGLIVTSSKGRGLELGLNKDDVIEAINFHPLTSLESLKSLPQKQNWLLLVNRNGSHFFVARNQNDEP